MWLSQSLLSYYSSSSNFITFRLLPFSAVTQGKLEKGMRVASLAFQRCGIVADIQKIEVKHR